METSGGDDRAGGDPACWAHLLCLDCGAWLGEAGNGAAATCPACGADLDDDRA